MLHISDGSSIFTAEAKGVELSQDFIRACDIVRRYIIFSGSLSVLKAMYHTSLMNP